MPKLPHRFAEVATKARELGYSTIPVKPRKKSPIYAGWQVYNDRPPTAEMVAHWTQQNPEAGMGIVASSKRGYLMIDCDVLIEDKSRDCWRALVHIIGVKPPTRVGRAPKWTALVGTGGKTIASRKPHPFEIFGSSGQVVAYGLHPHTLEPYRWYCGSPTETPIEELPIMTDAMVNQWLIRCHQLIGEIQTATQLERYQRTKSTTTSRSDLSAARSGLRGADYSTVIKQQLEEMNDGNRGTTLISVVTSLVGRGFSRAQIIRIANKPYLERFANDEDHGPAYLDKIIDNAERAIERRPWGGTT